MTWYAATPALRTRQVLLDLSVGLWVLLWWRVGGAVHDVVSTLAVPGRELEQAGRGLSGGLSDAAGRVGEVPRAGDDLRAPLDAAAGAATAVAEAGVAQQDAVATLAVVLTVLLAGIPIVGALATWLPRRVRWARRAHAARRLREDVDLWALRAAMTQPLPALARLGPDPVGRWRRGEPGAAEALAALERRAYGMKG